MPATLRGRLIAAAGAGALLIGGIAVGRAVSAPQPPQYATRAVARADLRQTVTLVGTVKPASEIHLTFRPGGTLGEVLVKVGQRVSEGQPLARLDTADLGIALRRAQADLLSAQARYDGVMAGATAQDIALASQAVEAARIDYDQARKSAATDEDSARQALERIKTSFANARSNFAAVVGALRATVAGYTSAIGPARDTLAGVIASTDALLPSADLDAARESLQEASVDLADAQRYLTEVLTPALEAYATAVDEVSGAIAAFDAAISADLDPTNTLAAYQSAEDAYGLASARLASAIDVPNGEVEDALTAIASAGDSLSTLDEADRYVLDEERADVADLATTLTDLDEKATQAKARLTQATAALATITATVDGGYVAALDALVVARDRSGSAVGSLEIGLRNAQTRLDKTLAGATATEVTQALASVQLAQIAVDKAKLDLARATLTAPAAGTVAAVIGHAGETVGAPADVIVLALTSSLVLHGSVGESEVVRVEVGQAAEVVIDTTRAKARLTGSVTGVDPVATTSASAPGYGIDVTLDAADEGVRPGMTGTALIVVASKPGVLAVPSSAIRKQGDRTFVRVLAAGLPSEADVTLGVTDVGLTEITKGLEQGQLVLVPRERTTTSNGVTVSASEPFAYGAAVEPTLERVAVVVTITNRSEDDLTIDPSDFAARDDVRRLYPSDPKSAVADARAVRAEALPRGMVGIHPLPGMVLRKDDVLEGFVVFEMTAGVRPAQIILRRVDEDLVVDLAAR